MPPNSELPAFARQMAVPERTLRRAVSRGTVRCRRLGPRRVAIDPSERAFLTQSWPLIAAVTQVLRTERNVRLAVIFGSTARGQAQTGSDLDLLVALAEERPMYAQRLSMLLEERLDREVDVLSLARVAERDPALLSTVLAEGRPVIDRDGLWPALLAQRENIVQAASAARSERARRAAEAIVRLSADGGQ
jgi:predicted nucleotidyltransferase